MGPGASAETYQLIYQLSDDASGNGQGFDAGDLVVVKALVHLGDVLGPDGDQRYTAGRIVFGVDNEVQGTIFRFARMAHVLAGTAPSINYQAWFVERK